MNSSNKTFLAIGVTAVIGAATIGGYSLLGSGSASDASTATGSSQAASSTIGDTPVQLAEPTSTYKNGTYTASVSYRVPGGDTNTITTTLTIGDDTISTVEASNDYADHESEKYTSSFTGQISTVAAGQPITTSFSRIGGASLTTEAFNQTLADIATQAKI